MARFFKTGVVAAIAIMLVGGGAIGWVQYRPLAVTALEPDSKVVIKVFGLGTVEARVLAKLGFKVAGRLTDLRADHGDHVKAGQVLARIGNSEQSSRLDKARAQVLIAEAAVEVATAAARKSEALLTQRKQTNRRRQELLARQAVSVEAAEDAQLNEKVAEADALVTKTEIETAKAKLDDARAQQRYDRAVLNQHELRAPFDAVVVQRTRELGSVLAAGEALFTLVAPETVWVLAYVDEGRAGDLRVGQKATVRLRSLPQYDFEAHVSRIGIESDRVNEERRVYVTCDTCPEAFFLGEQAEVYITTAVLERALMVPESMLDRFDGTTGTIWTVENGTLHRRSARFGRKSLDGRLELIGGLPEGAVVPAAVSADFREGRSVGIAGRDR